MLLRFSAANHLSLCGAQEISLIAGRTRGVVENLRFDRAPYTVLPAAVIYGPNASGKSNMIAALRFMRAAILNSHLQGNPEGGVPRSPFAFDPEAKKRASVFEADFLVEGVRYQYGFEANDNVFHSEWLYSFPEGKRRKLFERTLADVSFGSSMKGQKKILVDLMRPNSLFLSTATQNDHEELSKIRKFFKDIFFHSDISVADYLLNSTFEENEIDPRTIEFLKKVGTGVTGYRKLSADLPESSKLMLADMRNVLKKHLGDDAHRPTSKERNVTIELSHQGIAGEKCFLELDRESSGTRRLLLMMNSIFRALDEGSVVVVDELDASLHTYATEAVLALFDDVSVNKDGAQIIATIHDTNILTSEFLNRDQVWFAEKSEEGKTSFFSLAEIKSRSSDNFEIGYLQGRYGAIIKKPKKRRSQGVEAAG